MTAEQLESGTADASILKRARDYAGKEALKAACQDRNAIYDGLANVKSGKKSVGEVIDEAAAGLTGSGLLALGAYMFAAGMVTGAQGDDKDDKWVELLGHQGYALEFSDGTSITLDWLAPESLLQSVNDLIDSVQYALGGPVLESRCLITSRSPILMPGDGRKATGIPF